MSIHYADTYTLYNFDNGQSGQFQSLEAAMRAASDYVGNTSYAKPFPNSDTYLYGPGDGTTSIQVRRDFTVE
jgi:hypothetical protein